MFINISYIKLRRYSTVNFFASQIIMTNRKAFTSFSCPLCFKIVRQRFWTQCNSLKKNYFAI